MTNAVFGDFDHDQQEESIFLREGALFVYKGKKRLYKSGSGFGAGNNKFTYRLYDTARDTTTNTVFFEVPPIFNKATRGGDPRIFTTHHPSSQFLVTSFGNKRKQRIVTVWNDNGVVKEDIIPGQDGPSVVGMFLHGNDLYALSAKKKISGGNNFSSTMLKIPVLSE